MLSVLVTSLLIFSGSTAFKADTAGNAAVSLSKESILTEKIETKLNVSIKSLGDTLVYPRSADQNKPWKTAATLKDWTIGFFPGILWYTYELTGNKSFAGYAGKWTDGLSSLQYYSGSHDVGFIIFCSYGNAYRLTKDEKYKNVILHAAEALMKRYSPSLGVIRSWDHSKEKWDYPVIIDNMMNLELLLWASKNGGSQNMYDAAVSHAEKTMLNHFRPDGSTFHVVSYDTLNGSVKSRGTHQGYSDGSCWARGQAWAVYGFTMAYRYTKDERFLNTAKKAADYFISRLPKDKIPYWDFNAPGIPIEPRDASAAAIASSALWELSSFCRDNELKKKYYLEGENILNALSASPYFTDGSRSFGLINHCVGNKPGNLEVDVSLVYGDYYFLEALTRYKKNNTLLPEEALNK